MQLHVRDASDEQIHNGSGVADVAKLDFSHVNPVSGPVFVKGAKPGDILEVKFLAVEAKDWGWTAIIPGFGLLADEFPDPWLRISEVDAAAGTVRFGEMITLPHRPFPGTLGVAIPGARRALDRPAVAIRREHGRQAPPSRGQALPAGRGRRQPLFSLGDTHAAQGDGEVCGTAIETAMDVILRLTVRRDFSIQAPQFHLPSGAEVEDHRTSFDVCTGVGPDLMEASRDAVRATIVHLGDRYGLEREEAYAVASVAADLRIHEVVDAPNWVVGAFIPEAIFEGGR